MPDGTPSRDGSHHPDFAASLPAARRSVCRIAATGRQVWRAAAGSEGDMQWRLRDQSGVPAGTGVYRAVAESRQGLKSVLFAIQR